MEAEVEAKRQSAVPSEHEIKAKEKEIGVQKERLKRNSAILKEEIEMFKEDKEKEVKRIISEFVLLQLKESQRQQQIWKQFTV